MLTKRCVIALCLMLILLGTTTAGERRIDVADSDNTISQTTTGETRSVDDGSRSADAHGTPLFGQLDADLQKSLLPHELEVQLFGGEFEAWDKAKVIFDPSGYKVRLAPNTNETVFFWQLATEPYPTSNIVASGSYHLSSTTQLGPWYVRDIPAWGLPATPPTSATDYYLRLVDATGKASNSVVITYMADNNETRFTSLGLDPFALKPLRVFVDLKHFEIIDQNEGADEPYLINVLIVLDGSTVDVFDLPNSKIRLYFSSTTHGNIPNYNSNLQSGAFVAIPDETGRFVTTMAPINPELADVNFLGAYIEPSYLNRASTMVLISVAMEEDAVSTAAISSMRNALVTALRKRLNTVLQETTLADLLPLVTQAGNGDDGFDPLSLVPRPEEELCAMYEAQQIDPNIFMNCKPGWQQLQANMIDYAKEMAIKEELNSWNIFQIIASAVDPDDQIGAVFQTFNLQNIRDANQPIPVTMDFKRWDVVSPVPNDPKELTHYRVTGHVGRCINANPDAPCVPYYSGVYHNGVWVPGTGPALP